MPGTIGAIRTPASTPASRSRRTARRRWSGWDVPGSSFRQASSSTVGRLNVTLQAVRPERSTSRSASRTASVPLVISPSGVGMADQRFQDTAGEAVTALDRLVRIGGGSQGDYPAAESSLRQLAGEHVRKIGLDEHHRREIVSRAELQLRLVAAGETVVAAVGAAAVGVQRPAEGHPLHAVEGRAAGDFLVGRPSGAEHAVPQAGGAGFSNRGGHRPGGRPAPEIEQRGLLRHGNSLFVCYMVAQQRIACQPAAACFSGEPGAPVVEQVAERPVQADAGFPAELGGDASAVADKNRVVARPEAGGIDSHFHRHAGQ